MHPSCHNIVLVGCGHLGKWHLDKLLANAEVNVVAVVESSKERVTFLRTQYPHVNFLTDVQLLDNLSYEAVVIAAHTSVHYTLIKYFQNIKKTIFCEKPVVQTEEEYQALMRSDKAELERHMVGHIERHRPEWSDPELVQAVHQARYLQFDRCAEFKDRSLDVSVIDDIMIHDLDLLLSWWGAPESIRVVGQKSVGQSWDQVVATFFYDKGRIAILRGIRNYPFEIRKISGFGESGQFENNMLEKKCQIKMNATPSVSTTEKQFPQFDGLATELEQFIQVLKGAEPPKVSFVDGLLALKWAKEISRSLEELENN